jgi:hypothetical protein
MALRKRKFQIMKSLVLFTSLMTMALSTHASDQTQLKIQNAQRAAAYLCVDQMAANAVQNQTDGRWFYSVLAEIEDVKSLRNAPVLVREDGRGFKEVFSPSWALRTALDSLNSGKMSIFDVRANIAQKLPMGSGEKVDIRRSQLSGQFHMVELKQKHIRDASNKTVAVQVACKYKWLKIFGEHGNIIFSLPAKFVNLDDAEVSVSIEP